MADFSGLLGKVEYMGRIEMQNNLDSFSVKLSGDEPLSKMKIFLKKAILEEILKRDQSPHFHKLMKEIFQALKTNESGYRCCLIGENYSILE